MIKQIIKPKREINYSTICDMSHKNITKLVSDAESYLTDQLNEVTQTIYDNNDDIDVILVSGPSCAGKTTFSEMLVEQLENKGIKTIIISLDNFFYDRDKTPFLEDGVTRDFESPQSLNLVQMCECFDKLRNTGECKFPIFDFINGKNLPDSMPVSWEHPTKIIVEGIHALNPQIIESIGFKGLFKIYICANASFVEDGEIAISDIQLRYMRRITRDRVTRGHTPLGSYHSWPHVIAGENIYVVPYKQYANYVVDTVHAYEPCLYRFYTTAILGSMKYSGDSLYLQHTLSKVKAHSKTIIPENSLMWEFIKN